MKQPTFAAIPFVLVFSLILLTFILTLTPSKQATVVAHVTTPTTSTTTAKPTPTLTPILTVNGPAPTLSARASYLIDMNSGDVLENVNGETPMPMASATKIMTALIAIQTGNPNQLITVQQDAINRIGYSSDGNVGSSAYLEVGEQLTLKDLLYALLLPSGDDAAMAIADGLAGSSRAFVQRMNLFAYRLNLFQTHYINPDGLSITDQENAEHYTTAANLTTLTIYAMKIPLFRQIVDTATYSVPATAQNVAHTWTNTDTLLGVYAGILGIKTGHTVAAGWCLVFAARRNGQYLLGVVLDTPSEAARNQAATTLLNWGFALPLRVPSF